jgi:hypothetical protein
MYLSLCPTAIEECDNVRVVQISQNLDFGFEIVLELLAEFSDVDRLDRDEGSFLL